MTEQEFLHLKELTVKRNYDSDTDASRPSMPASFVLKTEFALGVWANAVSASINFGTSGSVGGIAASTSSDMILPNRTFPSGEYTTLHLSFGQQASSVWNATLNPVSFMVLENWGTTAEFDSKAFLMNIKGLGEGRGKLFSAGASGTTVAATLKIRVGSTTYYLMLSSAEAN